MSDRPDYAGYLAIADAATAGPWEATHRTTFGDTPIGFATIKGPTGGTYRGVRFDFTNADADFIAASRQIGPAAVRRVLRLEHYIKQARMHINDKEIVCRMLEEALHD